MEHIIESRDITQDGITYRVSVVHDMDVDPRTDGDWATDADIAAWKRDEWEYVTVDITPVIDATEIAEARTSLGACVYGSLPNNEIGMDEIISGVVPDMLPEARRNLTEAIPTLLESNANVRDALTALQGKLSS